MDIIVPFSSPIFWIGIVAAMAAGIACGLLYIYRLLGKRIKND